MNEEDFDIAPMAAPITVPDVALAAPSLEQSYIPEPDNLRAIFFANDSYLVATEELVEQIKRVDLVVSLGGVDLNELAKCIPAGKEAIAVMGPGDKPAPPPFKALHGTGVLFRSHWRIAGLSGAPKLGPGAEGLYLTESDSEAILMPLPAADIFLSYSPSSDLEFSNINTHQGFDTLGKYLSARPPIYHFYAHPNESIAEDRGEYLAIGVCGKLICDGQNDERPSLPYF